VATGIGILYRNQPTYFVNVNERCPCECPEGITGSRTTASVVLNFVIRWS